MESMIKKSLYAGVGVALSTQANLVSAINLGEGNVAPDIIGSSNTADVSIQNLIGTAATFLAILAVVYGIWGGFNILTAGGEEEKVKKGKTILVQAAIGLIIIWLANSIVQWIITKLLAPSV